MIFNLSLLNFFSLPTGTLLNFASRGHQGLRDDRVWLPGSSALAQQDPSSRALWPIASPSTIPRWLHGRVTPVRITVTFPCDQPSLTLQKVDLEVPLRSSKGVISSKFCQSRTTAILSHLVPSSIGNDSHSDLRIREISPQAQQLFPVSSNLIYFKILFAPYKSSLFQSPAVVHNFYTKFPLFKLLCWFLSPYWNQTDTLPLPYTMFPLFWGVILDFLFPLLPRSCSINFLISRQKKLFLLLVVKPSYILHCNQCCV